MNKNEKNQVLTALVSELRYSNDFYKKNNSNHKFSLENNHTKETIKLYTKLVTKWFKNDIDKQQSYIDYLNTILNELKEMEGK
jgi:hypothetical protein